MVVGRVKVKGYGACVGLVFKVYGESGKGGGVKALFIGGEVGKMVLKGRKIRDTDVVIAVPEETGSLSGRHVFKGGFEIWQIDAQRKSGIGLYVFKAHFYCGFVKA